MQSRTRDGTVPYKSLSWCKEWEKDISVVVYELQDTKRRDFLKHNGFIQIIAELLCN